MEATLLRTQQDNEIYIVALTFVFFLLIIRPEHGGDNKDGTNDVFKVWPLRQSQLNQEMRKKY